MELMLKQRLVGAAVIIALAVVLIPMILDGAGKHLVPDIPHEPNYLKTHLRQKLIAHSQNISAKNGISSRKVTVMTVPLAAPQSAKLMSDTVSIPRTAGSNYSSASRLPTRLSDSARIHNRASVNPRNTTGLVKIARAGSVNSIGRTSFSRLKRKSLNSSRTINSSPERRRSVYAAIKVWSVQIASFNSPANARILKQKLNKAGFKAYILRSRVSVRRKTIYRVRIGPEASHSKARAMLAKLRQKIRLNGYITSHK